MKYKVELMLELYDHPASIVPWDNEEVKDAVRNSMIDGNFDEKNILSIEVEQVS